MSAALVPGLGRIGRLVKSISEWQPQHCSIPSTRYLPRDIRSDVRAIGSVSSVVLVCLASEARAKAGIQTVSKPQSIITAVETFKVWRIITEISF